MNVETKRITLLFPLFQILKFESDYLRNLFLNGFRHYLAEVHVEEVIEKDLSLSSALEIAVTREERQNKLEMFFRVVFAQVCMCFYLALN